VGGPAVTTIHLTFRNHGGSVEHFYHFFFGYLVPLCDYLEGADHSAARLLVRSCGPMDRLLAELDVRGLEIVPKSLHRRLERKVRADPAGLVIERAGTDLGRAHRAYDDALISRATDYLRARWRARIEAYRRELGSVWSARWPRLLVIERGQPDPFYATRQSERKQAALERRHLPNHAEIVSRVEVALGNCLSRRLEHAQLAEQIALFEAADVVIAQHGAALSNVVWMRPGSAVLEIAPGIGGTRRPHFELLARSRGVRYAALGQAGSHVTVPAERVVQALRRLGYGPRENGRLPRPTRR
jgi:hypothetical protein